MTRLKCQLCGRKLTSETSIELGIGPECREKQTRFLAAANSSLEEIGQLTLLNDPTVTRWLTSTAKAIGAGRQEEVTNFIEAARRAAATAAEAREYEHAA